MSLISGGTFVIKRALGPDLIGQYNRLILISVDIISKVYSTVKSRFNEARIYVKSGFKVRKFVTKIEFHVVKCLDLA